MSHRARALARTSAISLVALLVLIVGSGFETAPPASAPAPTPPAPAAAAAPTRTPAFIQGEVRGEDFRIPHGERVMVVSDVRIYATREVVIDGLLLSKPGVTIEIVAPKLTVRGAVRAGDGANGVDVLEPGANGGSIILRVAELTVEDGASIRSGTGGNGNFGASGGKGGDILMLPTTQARGMGDGALEAGAGGEGGEGVNGYTDPARDGGNGGEGGAVGVLPSATA